MPLRTTLDHLVNFWSLCSEIRARPCVSTATTVGQFALAGAAISNEIRAVSNGWHASCCRWGFTNQPEA